MCGECEFRRVYCRNGEICIEIKTNEEVFVCDKYGYYFYGINGEVIIFPSKENRDWSKFQRPFKDGDIVSTMNGIWIGIVKRKVGNAYETYATTIYDGTTVYNDDTFCFERLATEEEREKLFKAIKDNGYKWNPKTKTLEKLVEPKFKVGDKIVKKKGISVPVEITSVGDDFYYSNTPNSNSVDVLHPI